MDKEIVHNQNQRNPFLIPNILETLIHFASIEELSTLRQLSTNFNTNISQLYFDILNKTIVINPRERIGPWEFLSKNQISLELLHIYRQIIIKDLDFMDPNAGANGQEVIEFLKKIGLLGRIKLIEIWIDYYRTVSGLNFRVKNNSNLIKPFLLEVAGYFVNLQSLNIQQV